MSATSISVAAIPAGTYNVDPAHSNVGFEVRHLGIATVRGKFGGLAGTIDTTGTSPVFKGSVQVSTIDTGEENRDGHLKGAEFFDAEQHPEITFSSSGDGDTAGGKVSLAGEITIKGITKPIELTGVVAGPAEDPWGNERVGLELEGVIDRRDFDLKWNQTLPNGNLLLANEVKLLLGVSAIKAA